MKNRPLGPAILMAAAGDPARVPTQLTALSFKTVLSGFVVLLAVVAPSFSQQPTPPSGVTEKFAPQTKGTYTDTRDHKVYQTVRIGNQIWFAENFAYLPSVNTNGVFVYGYTGDSVSQAKMTASYQKYGALYTWEQAKKLAPGGWHLPTDADWQQLEMQIGIEPETVDTVGWRGKNRQADSLKAGGSTGFNAWFGGWRTDQGTFNFQGQHANFWVADSYDAGRAYERLINYKSGSIGRDVGQKGCGFSVRYVRDLPESAESFAKKLSDARGYSSRSDWPNAEAAWQQIVTMNPVNGTFWNELATAKMHLGEYPSAIVAHQRVMELGQGPGYYGYRYSPMMDIARSYAKLGNTMEAMDWIDHALAAGFRPLDELQHDDTFLSLREVPRFREEAGLPPSHLSRVEGWRFDLHLLAREARRLHYGYRNHAASTSRRKFDEAVLLLDRRIPSLTDLQIEVEMMKIVALLGDGHTMIRFREWPVSLPVTFFKFQEGLFIVSADSSHKDLLGARVVSINRQSAGQALQTMQVLIGRENEMRVADLAPDLLRYPYIQEDLTNTKISAAAPLELRFADGRVQSVTLTAAQSKPDSSWVHLESSSGHEVPLYQRNADKPYWFEYLEDSKTVYFKFNLINSPRGFERLKTFRQRLFQFIDSHDVERLVIDLRDNPGGDNFNDPPFIHDLLQCPKVNQPNSLYVIIGRKTFSAAIGLSVMLERFTNAVFVGEPTGSSPNFIGEDVPLVLPYSGMHVSISDLYWQYSVAMDYRPWLAPQIYAPPSFPLFRDGRDPAMEAILAERR